VITGGVLLVLGLGAELVSRFVPGGRLPGDFVIRRGNFTLFLPIATSVILSVLLTVVFRLLRRD
jgi:hypothetical protein